MPCWHAGCGRWISACFSTRRSIPQLVQLAEHDQRWLLTRDRALVTQRRPDYCVLILIAAEALLEQLREVIERCRTAAPQALFTRCLVCISPCRRGPGCRQNHGCLNGPGAFLARFVIARVVSVTTSHTWRMRERLARTLPEWF